MKIRTKKDSIKIPEGYEAISTSFHGNTYSDDMGLRIHIGKVGFYENNNFEVNSQALNNETVEIPIALYSRIEESDRNAYAISIDIECSLTQAEKDKWLGETTIAIMSAYNKKLQEYNDAMAQYEAQMNQLPQDDGTTDYNNNPLKNRKIEQTELKKIAIQYMLSQSKNNVGEAYNFGSRTNCDNGIVQSKNLNDYAEIVRFFEEAIDWKIMDYTFHPYFWANCSNDTWQEMLKTTSKSDPIFEAFLQAGFATMRVPVKAGYEKALMFFLDTGRIWKKGDVLVQDLNNEYLSIDDSLKINPLNSNCCNKPDRQALVEENNCTPKEEICIEAKWSSRVPTALTIVQDYSMPLSANGLPCFSKDDPKIKFCEDGTPLGGLNQIEIDQNGGVMVGLDNDDLAYDCNILLQSHANLSEAYTIIVDALADGSMDNATALPQLQDILNTLNYLLDTGNENNCNVAPLVATIATVEDKITEIS